MKNLTTLLVLCIFCFGIAKAETEPNNVWNQANVITLGATGTGTAALNFDEDWWRVATPGDGKITVNWSSLNGSNVFCQLYDSLGVTLFISAYTTNSSVINFDGLAKGTYYLRFITYYNTESTDYSFVPTFTAAPVANDPEINDVFTQAVVISQNDSVTGHIGYFYKGLDDLTDWYKITPSLDGRIDFKIYSLNGQNVFAELFASDATTILAGGYTVNSVAYSKDGLAPGTYYIRIRTFYNSEFAPYALKNNLILPPNTTEIGGANGTYLQATAINLNDSVNGHIGYTNFIVKDTIDWFKVTTTSDGKISVKLNVLNSQNVFAQLFDGDGVTYLTGSYTINSATYVKDGLAAGTYYIRITTFYITEFAPYALKVTLDPTVPDDPEPNNSRALAVVINPNDSVTGHTGYYYNGYDDLEDWYKMTIPGDGQINFTITSLNGQNVYANLYDNDGVTYLAGNYTINSVTFSANGLAAGTYYFQIKTFYTSEFAPYAFKPTFIIAPNNDQEPNGTVANALILPVNTTVNGHTNYYYNHQRDTFDYYALTLPVDGKLNWTITSLNGQNVYASLFDHNGTTLLAENYSINSITQQRNNLAAGTYYIRVRTFYNSEFAGYTLSTTLEPMNYLADNLGNNDFAALGQVLPANTPTGGHLAFYYDLNTDQIDWWQIGYDGTGNMTFQLNIEQNHFDGSYPYFSYALYSDTTAAAIQTGLNLNVASNTFNFTGLAVGKYYLRITPVFSTFGAYQLTASYTERCLTTVAIGASSQQIGCVGSITYNLSGGLSPYSVQLYKNGLAFGAPQSGANAVTFNGLGLGTYYAKAYSFGGSGQCNNTSGNTVFAAPAVPVISGGPLAICQGSSVTLTSSANSAYLWSNGATTQSINVSSAGNYSVTVSNAAGCSNTSAAVTVSLNALPSAAINGVNTVCNGGSTTLTASGGGTYLWSTSATTTAITVSPSTTTAYTVTVTNGNGCTASANTSVTVNSSSAASISGTTTICNGGSTTLTSSAGASYLWSTGATTQSITVSPAANTSYNVTVTYAGGCTASASANVLVNSSPTASINGTTTICNGGSTTLTSSAGASYLWSTGATTQSITVNPAANTSYSVTVTYAGGCTASASANVLVNSSSTASISGNTALCSGSSTTLTATAGSSYVWSTGATTQTITVSPIVNTSYTVTVSYAGGCTASATASVVVSNCNGTYCAAGGTNSGKGYIQKVAFKTIGKSSGWNGGYANFTNLSTTVSKGSCYTITITPGFLVGCGNKGYLYTRVWIDWNQDGDFNDVDETVFAPTNSSVNARVGSICVPAGAIAGTTRMRVAMRYSVVPTSCGTFTYGEVEDYSINVAAGNARIEIPTEQESKISFNLFPNPANDFLTIELSLANSIEGVVSTEMQILDLSGKIVLHILLTQTTELIDVKNLPNGMYIVQLLSAGSIDTKKIVISH